jgi:hypothetical protein
MSKNLYQRLIGVMRTMGAIGKGGQATYGDHYAYHKIDDIDDKLRDALIEHGVMAMVIRVEDDEVKALQEPPDKYGKVKTTWYCICKITIEFVNVDNPEDRTRIVGWGQGLDNSDKATGKAFSYALKAAYLSAFHLRGQPDNEADNITKPFPVADQPPAGGGQGRVKMTIAPTSSVKTEDQRLWVDRLTKCDSVKVLEETATEFRNQPVELQASIEPVYTEAHKRCWMLDMDRCQTVADLEEFPPRLRGKPQYLLAPLQVFYPNKLASLKAAAAKS